MNLNLNYKPVEYVMGVTVSKALIGDMKSFNSKIRQREICEWHTFNYAFCECKYRKYKRGKNRCHFCGVKI